MTDRRKVAIDVFRFGRYDLTGSWAIDGFLRMLMEYVARVPAEHRGKMRVEATNDGGEFTIRGYYERPETLEEQAARLREEDRRNGQQINREYAEYLRLKAKFDHPDLRDPRKWVSSPSPTDGTTSIPISFSSPDPREKTDLHIYSVYTDVPAERTP